MNVEDLRTYCLSLPHVTEHFPFDDVSLVLKVHGKMFALIPLDNPEICIALKCEPNKAVLLREQYEAVTPAYHFNKKHWNMLYVAKAPTEEFVKENICHSYKQVVMNLPLKLRPAYSATIGFFDGVHLGHLFLLNELNAIAQNEHQQSMAITFGVHPRKVLCSSFQPKLLTDNEEKAALLSTLTDEVEMLDFTTDMAELTAQEFMLNVLKKQLNVKTLLLGYDHHFGSDRQTDFTFYEKIGGKLGIKVIKATQYTKDGQHISSSTIRNLIEAGDIQEANRLLGHPYQLSGTVVNGYQIGRKLGFPTANIQPCNTDKLIPKTGVYAVEIIWQGQAHSGMLNIGSRPTLEQPDARISIEAHIFDFEGDLYNELLTIRFLHHIRNEIHFQSIDELKKQLEQDRLICLQTITPHD